MQEPVDPIAERAKARVGSTLKDKWHIDALLGLGGMAAVYSATHRNGMRVGIKVLHTELSVNSEVRSRFMREGYLANKVEHPGAVQVLDDEVAEDGAVFLVMELLEGATLADRRARAGQSLPVEEVLIVADQVLDVLRAAHAKSIVHRDIKPDNIFILRTGSVKVLDFGIARLRELSGTTQATRSGALMGTPAYMAPEQARARWDEVDARTDLWSLGATMFSLLSGRAVHEADTLNEQLLSAMTNPAPSIATFAPALTIPVVEVIDRALEFDKNGRWTDAEHMQAAVRTAYQMLTGVSCEGLLLPEPGTPERQPSSVTFARTAVAVARPSEIPPHGRGRRRVLLVSAIALVALVVGYALWPGGTQGPTADGADAGLPPTPLAAAVEQVDEPDAAGEEESQEDAGAVASRPVSIAKVQAASTVKKPEKPDVKKPVKKKTTTKRPRHN
jgi:serine/threonine-protein kinase